MHAHTRRTVVAVVKIAFAVAILLYLLYQGRDALSELSKRTIEWPMLGAALVCTALTALLGFLRWHILIRALGIDVRLVESMRLGALGFALNYMSLGSIGGDFFKAVFLAHGQPGRRTEAIATVVADRVIGLMTMLAIASVGILASGLLAIGSPEIKLLSRSILLFTAVSWAGFISLLLVDRLTGPWVRSQVLRLRLTGKTIARLLDSIQVYRGEKRMLAAAFGVSVAMALFYITSFYLVARGLPIQEPPWSEHLVIVPISSLVGAIPLTPAGVGTTEYVFDEMYRLMPGGKSLVKGDGGIVGIGRRLTDIAVAIVGMVFYVSRRREVREVLDEAEQIADEEKSGSGVVV
jgi:uncharacterized protein (TIRG00374 family)